MRRCATRCSRESHCLRRTRRRSRPVKVLLGVALAVTLAVAGPMAQSRPIVASAAVPIYQRLLPQIEQIKIFDHHAHPGFAGDEEVDPAPVPPSAAPWRLRPEHPDWA